MFSTDIASDLASQAAFPQYIPLQSPKYTPDNAIQPFESATERALHHLPLPSSHKITTLADMIIQAMQSTFNGDIPFAFVDHKVWNVQLDKTGRYFWSLHISRLRPDIFWSEHEVSVFQYWLYDQLRERKSQIQSIQEVSVNGIEGGLMHVFVQMYDLSKTTSLVCEVWVPMRKKEVWRDVVGMYARPLQFKKSPWKTR